MNTPKLPPLPEPNLIADPCDANGTQTNYYTEATVMRLLAAIEAQGVSDANAEFNRAIDFAIEQGIEAAVFLRCWREGDTSEWPEFTPMLASAPPAPQADRSGCTAGTDEECKHRHCATHCPKQTAVVQQEPVVFCTYPSCHGEGKTCTGPCATQPIQKAAKQAKPQPLSDARIEELERQLAEARKDAERIDWLSSSKSSHGFCHTMYGEYLFYAHQLDGFPTVREVIDNAMQKG